MSATFTPVPRRTFGLNRIVFAVRCAPCKWRTEVRTAYQAAALVRLHECKDEAA